MNRTELLGLLPGIFQRGLRPSDGEVLERLDAGRPPGPRDVQVLSALAAVLDVMVDQQTPAHAALERFPEALFPERAPKAFLALLAEWLHVDRRMTPDEASLRAVLTHGARLWRKRGTQEGLEDALECVLGHSKFSVEIPPPSRTAPRRTAVRFRTFHVRIHVPTGRQPWRPALERLVDAMKPIHMSHELVFDR